MSAYRQRIRCTAHRSTDGQPCKAWAIHGTTVCHAHGGRAPKVKAAAAKRVAVAKARRQLDIPEHVDPRDALAEELARTIAWVRWLSSKVDAVDDTDLIWGATKTVDKLPGPATDGGIETTAEAKTSIWWNLYDTQRKHLIEVAKTAHACGVEDRRVELAMRQAEVLVQIVTGMIADLGLNIDDPATKTVVVSWLRKAEAIEATAMVT